MDNTNANIDLIRSHVDIIILKPLESSDKYGYEILREIETNSKGLYTLKQPTLYSCLKRLEKQGYIRSYLGDESNGAQRRYYSLTQQGRDFLISEQSQWEFVRTILGNLVSNEEFDKEKDVQPFDPTKYRPLTKRTRNTEEESEIIENVRVVEKIVYIPVPADENKIDNSQLKKVDDFSDAMSSQDVESNRDNAEFDTYEKDALYTDPYEYHGATEHQTTYNEYKSESAAAADTTLEKSLNDSLFDYTGRPSLADTSRQDEDELNYITALEAIYNKPKKNHKDNAMSRSPQIHANNDNFNDYRPTANFSELKNRMYQNYGYKIKPYTRLNTGDFYVNNYYYSNTAARDCSILMYMIFFIESLIVHLTLSAAFQLKFTNFLAVVLSFAIVPIAFTVNWALNPNYKKRTKFNLNLSLLIGTIAMLNALLIILLVGFFVAGATIDNFNTMVIPIIVPSCFLINIPLTSLVYAMLYHSKRYNLRSQFN